MLELYATRYFGKSQSGEYTLYKLSRTWSDADADWEQASEKQPWSNPGGDFSPDPVSTVYCPQSAGKTWVRFNVLSAVKTYPGNPSANFGFIIINSMMSQEVDFVSSEGTDATLRPKLTVIYETDENPVRQDISHPVCSRQLEVHTAPNMLYLTGNVLPSPTPVQLLTPGGKTIWSGHPPPFRETVSIQLGAGCYLIVQTDRIGRKIVYPAIIP